MNIYIDIDGVLLHDSLRNNGKLAEGAKELLEFLTSNHTCYWLTTHCRGGENRAVQRLRHLLPVELLEKIQPTDWGSWKTEAIDFSQDFRWLDDDVYDHEHKTLDANGCREKLILIDLQSNPNQLKGIVLNI